MFGREYANNLPIILDSFGEMNHKYSKKIRKKQFNVIIHLQKIYIRLFGIPEIGFQARSLYFKKMIGSLKMKKIEHILDLGSGIGVYTFYLKDIFPQANILGVDIDKKKLLSSRKFLKSRGNRQNIKFTYADIENEKLGKNSFDLIVVIDVLEHVKNPSFVLKNAYSALKKGGFLFIHTPQINQRRFFNSFKTWSHEGHTREGFSPTKLKQELKKTGFKIVEQNNTLGYFSSLAWEINHLLLVKSFVLTGLVYPILYLMSYSELFTKNKRGLGIALLASKF